MNDHHFNHKNQNMLQKTFSKSCEIVNDAAEYFASLSIGQTTLKHTDRLLWTLEKSAEWSIPSPSTPKHTSNGAFGRPAPLIRPLPWLLFLPLLILLRITRFSLNIGSMLMGMEGVKASNMVRFIQVRRRRIRALKFLGLRRIRQRRLEQAEKLTWKETFYSIISRAMCFQVTNSDMYEEITVGKTNEPQATTSQPKKPVSGADLKRKYIEILKNNYQDWEDVEDDEELIERITQLADDDNNDPTYVPPEEEEEEDSATEDDSLSEQETEEYELSVGPSKISTQKPPLLRPSSLGSFTNETITEEVEEEAEDKSDSDSSTVSVDSGDESSQKINTVTGSSSSKTEALLVPKNNPKEEKNSQQLSVESGVTSDEYLSPMNSICPSPELKPEVDTLTKCNNSQNNNKQEIVAGNAKVDGKKESENLINKEKSSQVLGGLNNHAPGNASNGQSITAQGSPPLNNTSTPTPSSNVKTHKRHRHKRRFSNLLRRKRQ